MPETARRPFRLSIDVKADSYDALLDALRCEFDEIAKRPWLRQEPRHVTRSRYPSASAHTTYASDQRAAPEEPDA